MDPGALLPRDPLTLAIGLDGTYSLDPQALRPGFRMAPGAPPPITALTLNLTELMLSGLGVTFTGSGGMGLDFTDMTTFDGAPLPSGKRATIASTWRRLTTLAASRATSRVRARSAFWRWLG